MNKFEEAMNTPNDVESLLTDDWMEPQPITVVLPDVDSMTDELMPVPLKSWLSDVTHRMQTPADFATISAIVVIGSVIGSGCAIRPKKVDDWEVIPNVWGAAIGRPSVVLKTPSMQEVMRLIDRLQAKYGEEFEGKQILHEADKLVLDAKVFDIESRIKKAAKQGASTPQEIDILKQEYTTLKQNHDDEPSRRLFKTNETSTQSMTVLQNQNERGLLVFRDELTALLVRWDREDHADERAYFLEGWNGSGSFTDMKIGRGLTEAKNICISLLGGIQPDKLKRYLSQATKGNNDGLIQRLQLAVWPDLPDDWKLVDCVPDKAEKERVYGLIESLAELDFQQVGAIQDEYDDRPYFRFDIDGQQVFNDWLTHLQTVKIKTEENPLMAEHLGKFRSLMPSLALIFHCIDIADGRVTGPITEKSAQLAVAWCDYLESHARRIYATADRPEHQAAVHLSDKIQSKQLSSPFTARDVVRKGWHGLNDRQEVEAACDVLIEEDWLRIEIKLQSSSGGRPPLPDYIINPLLI